jgi:hypothetical protein
MVDWRKDNGKFFNLNTIVYADPDKCTSAFNILTVTSLENLDHFSRVWVSILNITNVADDF